MAASFSILVDPIFKNENLTVPEWFTPTDLTVNIGEITEDGKRVKARFSLWDRGSVSDTFTFLERTISGEIEITIQQLSFLFDDTGTLVIPAVNAILQPLNLVYKVPQ